jgi:uncharacterized protein YjbI with pentapeptide repeats
MLRAAFLVLGLTATGSASAFQCVYEPPAGRAFATADEVVEFVVEGDERLGETSCAAKARVVRAIKGSLAEGDGFRIGYEPEGSCGGLYSIGSRVLEGLAAEDGGIYHLSPCGGRVSEAVVRAYLAQKRDVVQAAARQPKSFAAQFRLAKFLVGWKDVPAAERALDAATALAPGDEGVALLRAQLALRTSRGSPARLDPVIEELRSLAPNSDVAGLLLPQVMASRKWNAAVASGLKPSREPARLDASRPVDLTGADLTGESFFPEILTGLSAAKSDWTATALVERNLAKANLDGAVFTHAIMDEAIFADASLVRAKFLGASVVGVDFSRARMQLANLEDLTAYGAKFADADLRGATVSGILQNGDFTGADLRGADVRGVFGDGISWAGARVDCATRLHRSIEPVKVGMVADTICPDAGEATK